MNDQLLGVLRAILAAAGGWAVGKGYIDNATATSVGGAIVTLAMAVWSVYSNTQKAKIQSINESDNGVRAVDEKAAIAANIPPVSAPLK